MKINIPKIVKGNDFDLVVSLKEKVGLDENGEPILIPFGMDKAADVVVSVKREPRSYFFPFDVLGNTITIHVDGTRLPNGIYGVEIVAKKEGNRRSFKNCQFGIVESDDEANISSSPELEVQTVELGTQVIASRGVSDYQKLTNKPKINGVELQGNRFVSNTLKVDRVGNCLPLMHPKGYLFAGTPGYKQIRKCKGSYSYMISDDGHLISVNTDEVVRINNKEPIIAKPFGDNEYYPVGYELFDDEMNKSDKAVFVKGYCDIYELLSSELDEGIYIAQNDCNQEGCNAHEWKCISRLDNFDYCYCRNKSVKHNGKPIKIINREGLIHNIKRSNVLSDYQRVEEEKQLIYVIRDLLKLYEPSSFIRILIILKKLSDSGYGIREKRQRWPDALLYRYYRWNPIDDTYIFKNNVYYKKRHTLIFQIVKHRNEDIIAKMKICFRKEEGEEGYQVRLLK